MSHFNDSMVVNKEYKKKLSGFVNPEDLSDDLDKLLKYYEAENVQPNLKQTKKFLSKYNVNEELINMREE